MRATVLAALTIVIASLTPAQVGRAQSAPPPLTPWRGLVDHVSVSLFGSLDTSSADLARKSVSADGRYVVFTAFASNLVPDDYNGGYDVFVRDRETGVTSRASVADDGSEAAGGSQLGSISANGRYVVFASPASNLVPGDNNGWWDIFVRDREGNRTLRMSVATDGTEADADSYWPVISADGRFVAFTSTASTLVPDGQPYMPSQAYVHDRDSDGNGVFDEPGGTETSLVSLSPAGDRADRDCGNVRISADGRIVMFESSGTNLFPGAALDGYTTHLYVRDRQAGDTAMIDRAVTGGPSSYGVDAYSSDMSDDGRFISYTTMSPDIVMFDMNWNSQVIRHDRLDATASPNSIVTKLPDGTVSDGTQASTAISGDGRYVAFRSTAQNLAAPAPPSGRSALLVRDMDEGAFARVDLLSDGTPFDHWDPWYPSISADGTVVTFESDARNVVPAPWSNIYHAFAVTAFAAAPQSASYPVQGGGGSIDVNTLPVSGWNAESLDPWIVLMDGSGFSAGPRTVTYLIDANAGGNARDGRIQLGSTTVSIHQDGDGDVTPPVITPVVTGTQVNGWYTSDIALHWDISDPESAFTVDWGCYDSVYTSDFMLATPSCQAASRGGTSYNSVSLRRDTTGPAIAITAPAATAYPVGSNIVPSFTCSDGSGSGVATCAATAPVDTATPGRKTFTVSATDYAGHSSSQSVEYIVGTGVCVSPNADLRAWWRLEGNEYDALGHYTAWPTPTNLALNFEPGVAGQAWRSEGNTYLDAQDYDDLNMWSWALTISAWVRPGGAASPEGATIVSKPSEYRLAVFPDGTLRWAFSQTTGFDWVNTGARLPVGVFSHVAVTYDLGLVKTYVNGRLVHTQQLTGTPTDTGNNLQSLTIGGRTDATAPFWGLLDEVAIFGAALPASDVEALALAGSGSMCLPKGTTLTMTAPPTVGYMGTIPVTLTLQDETGNPLAGKYVSVDTHLTPYPIGSTGFKSGYTDAFGRLSLSVPTTSATVLGTYQFGVNALFDGTADYTPSRAWASMTVVKGTPKITWSPASITYGTPLGAPQLNATANTAGTFAYAPAAGTKLDAGNQTLTASFTPDDLTYWDPVTATATLLVRKATPTIDITGGTFTYDKAQHLASVTVTGVDGEALSPVTVYYNNVVTVPINAGTYSLSAYYAGSTNYNSLYKTSTAQLIVAKYVPTVQLTGGPYTYDAQPHSPAIAVRGVGADSLVPFSYSIDGSGTAAPVQAGTHAVAVSYSGSTNYAAINVTDLSFVINKATPLIWIFSSNRFYDGTPQVTEGWASGVGDEALTPVVVTYNGSAAPPTNAGSYALVASYNGSANYNAVSTTGTMTILQGTPWLTWADPAPIVYGTALSDTQLNATAPAAGRFYYAQSAGTVLNAGTQTLSVLFVPDDQSNWLSSNKSVALTVLKATPTVSWPQPDAIVYGTALGGAQLNATSTAAGTFAYSPAAGTVLPAGAQTLSATFTPADAGNYNSATASVSLNVVKAAPVITWAAPADVPYGTPLSALQLNVSASVPGTYEFSPAVGTILPAGSHTLSVVFTPEDGDNFTTATASVVLTVLKATPIVDWVTPADITYGVSLGAAQLNATASTAGTLSYSPAAGTILPAGTHTLSVTFTPDDAANYTTATAAATLNVLKASTSVTWSAPAPIVYGTPLTAAQLDATSGALGSFTYSPAAGTVLFAGSHTLSVTFTPDDSANYTGSTASTTVTVTPAPLTVRANDATKPYGQPLPAFASTISGFVNGDAPTALSGALAYATPARLGSPVGAYPVTPSGVSSPNYAITFAAGTLTIVKAATVVTASAAPNPSGIDQPVTFSATVALAAPGGGFPTGYVQFFDGGTLVGTAVIADGPIVLTTAGLPAGPHTLTATYSGDGSFEGSSSTAAFVVNTAAASSSVTMSSSSNPSNPGQSVTFNAAVSGPAGTISGSVDFYDGATLLGSAPVIGTTASLTTAALATGGHAITARFGGNASVPPSGSPAFAQTVQATGTKPRSTTTAVSASPSPAALGTEIALTATVTGSQNRTPTGTVLFMANGTVIGSAPLSATGSTTAAATLGISTLPHGTHTISAVYLADANYRASAGTVRATVN